MTGNHWKTELYQYMKEEITINLYHPEEKSTSQYDVTPVGAGLFKLLNNDPFTESFTYGTIIEVEEKEEEPGVFRFKRIHKMSEFKMESCILHQEIIEKVQSVLWPKVVAAGGYAEIIMGGVCYFNLPPDSNLNIQDEIKKLYQDNS